MKKGYTDRWVDLNGCKNLLFFAQVVEELIFDYSIPSYRLPTLNSHYLCFDAIRTISDIDNHGVPEGTLRPIAEELYFTLESDPAFSKDHSPIKYYVKEQNGRFVRVYSPNDLNYTERRNIILAINKKAFNENSYYNVLKDRIIAIVKAGREEEQDTLFALTKSLITELVNSGYDQRFIRDSLIYNFFNKKTIVSSNNQIESFFSLFPFSENKYRLVAIADQSLQNIVSDMPNVRVENILSPKTTIAQERAYLQKTDTDKYFIFEDIEALDPYTAAERIKLSLNLRLSLYRLYDHTFDFSADKIKYIAYNDVNYYTIITPSISAVQRMRKPKESVIREKMEFTQKVLNKQSNAILLLLASNLHSLSLKSTSEENQILDLWAIVESVLDISQEHVSDRINQVCNYLVPIIKQNYLYSLFEQLLIDIKNYDETEYVHIVEDEEDDFQKIMLLASYISCDENKHDCDNWLEKCDDFPLLKFRIKKYRSILQTRGSLANHIERHSQRVRWQIMRAYRNRNLIIHNGETMPYTSLLVENLHAYTDILIDYIISGFVDGHNMRSMRQELFTKECEWIENTEKKNANIPIDQGFLQYALTT